MARATKKGTRAFDRFIARQAAARAELEAEIDRRRLELIRAEHDDLETCTLDDIRPTSQIREELAALVAVVSRALSALDDPDETHAVASLRAAAVLARDAEHMERIQDALHDCSDLADAIEAGALEVSR